jgi:hypothetical protein
MRRWSASGPSNSGEMGPEAPSAGAGGPGNINTPGGLAHPRALAGMPSETGEARAVRAAWLQAFVSSGGEAATKARPGRLRWGRVHSAGSATYLEFASYSL